MGNTFLCGLLAFNDNGQVGTHLKENPNMDAWERESGRNRQNLSRFMHIPVDVK
jgi:hypothetical protein